MPSHLYHCCSQESFAMTGQIWGGDEGKRTEGVAYDVFWRVLQGNRGFSD